MSQQFDSKSLGTHILNEVLAEIVFKLEGDGVIENHAALAIAENHGVGFLTGSAAAILDIVPSVIESGNVNQYEDDLMTAAAYAILAVVGGRLMDAEDEDDGGGPSVFPIIDAEAPVPEQTEQINVAMTPEQILTDFLKRLAPGRFYVAG